MKNWYEDIQKYFKKGLWTADMVQAAVVKGKLTTEQAAEIVGGNA